MCLFWSRCYSLLIPILSSRVAYWVILCFCWTSDGILVLSFSSRGVYKVTRCLFWPCCCDLCPDFGVALLFSPCDGVRVLTLWRCAYSDFLTVCPDLVTVCLLWLYDGVFVLILWRCVCCDLVTVCLLWPCDGVFVVTLWRCVCCDLVTVCLLWSYDGVFVLILWRCVCSDLLTVYLFCPSDGVFVLNSWLRTYHGVLILTLSRYSDLVTVRLVWPFHGVLILTWMFAAAVHGHAGDDQDPTRGVRRQTHLWGFRQQVSVLTSLHQALNHMLLVPYLMVPLQAAVPHPYSSSGVSAFSLPASKPLPPNRCLFFFLGALHPLKPYGLSGTGGGME